MIMKFLKEYGYSLYLGCCLALLGIYPWDWQFYAISVPVIILVNWQAST